MKLHTWSRHKQQQQQSQHLSQFFFIVFLCNKSFQSRGIPESWFPTECNIISIMKTNQVLCYSHLRSPSFRYDLFTWISFFSRNRVFLSRGIPRCSVSAAYCYFSVVLANGVLCHLHHRLPNLRYAQDA